MNSPMCIVLSAAALYEPSDIYDTRGAKTPQSIFSDPLFGRSFDVDVALAIAPDGRAESVLQHGQKRFRPFGARLKCSSDGQLTQRLIIELDLQGGVAHQFVDDVTQRLVLEIEAALSSRGKTGA